MRRFSDYFTAHREQLDALIFDIDGTLVRGASPIPEAVDFIARLQKEQFPYFFLTNDSGNSCRQKAEILCKCGIKATASQIISSGDAIAEYIRKNNLTGRKFFQCGELGIPNFAERAGLRITRDLHDSDDCEGAIVGEGVYDWQREIHGLLNFLLRHPGVPVLVGNPDSYWKGRRSIGIGAGTIIRMVVSLIKEIGGDVQTICIGKPYAPIYEYAEKHFAEVLPGNRHLQMSRIAMIGDSLVSDVRGAKNAGMLSFLVLTGISSREHIAAAPPECRPDEVFDTL